MARVIHKERCPDNAELRRFISEWELRGPFDIVLVTGDRNDAQQLVDFKIGREQHADGSWVIVGPTVTNAQTAKDSGHGHKSAGDFQPARELFPNGLPKSVYLGNEKDPIVRAEAVRRLEAMDQFAEDLGLETGRHYPGLCDRPHLADKAWRSRPLGPGVSA